LLNGLPLNAWKWMEKEPFETAYGVTGMVRERQKALHQINGSYRYRVCLSIITMIRFIASDLSGNLILLSESYFAVFGFGIAAIAVYLFVSVGIPYGAYKRLLQEGDFSARSKAMDRKTGPIIAIYWLLVTAIYLGYSLITTDWMHSWIIWPVAGVLGAILAIVLQMVYKKHDKN
ncbi:MAG: hypothetical protein SPH80_02230, partial [Peptoniphilaceae bacterium]|nr:hypothetical protein [Peptoniphilaceae bacterium]